jgi:2-oxoglutarate ferredoxin oxidoreductase subunit delta
MAAKGKINIDIDKCKGCEICITACKFGTISMSAPEKTNTYGYRYLTASNPDTCTACGFCAQMCPDSAITVFRSLK